METANSGVVAKSEGFIKALKFATEMPPINPPPISSSVPNEGGDESDYPFWIMIGVLVAAGIYHHFFGDKDEQAASATKPEQQNKQPENNNASGK